MRRATGAAQPRGAGVGRAGPSALGGGPSGRSAGGGRGQEPGEERIFLAHRLVADDGHFVVAWSSHQGDDPAALEEAEDALAGALDQLLDVLLGRRGRGVEHLPLAVAVWRVQTVEEEDVQMGVKAEVTVGAMDDGHGAGLAGGQAALGVPPSVPRGYGVREDAYHLTQQFPVEGEREAQGERHGTTVGTQGKEDPASAANWFKALAHGDPNIVRPGECQVA